MNFLSFFKKFEHPLHKEFREEAFTPQAIRRDLVRCSNTLKSQHGEIEELKQRIEALEKKVTEYWRVGQ